MHEYRKSAGAVACAALAAALLATLGATGSSAQQAGGFAVELPEVRNYVGVAAGIVPDYLGSDDYTVGAAPTGMVKFGDSERYAKLLVTEVTVNLLDNKVWTFGPAFNYRLSRDDDVDDKFVKRMRKIDGTAELGAFGGWQWVSKKDPRSRFGLSGEFLHDVGGTHEGYLVSASMRYFKPLSRPFTFGTGATLTYGSRKYMETYFGVDADNAARSGLTPFKASDGFRDIRVPIMGIFSFSPNWHISGGVVISQLLDDASDSPLVDDRGSSTQVYAGLGIVYAW